MKVILQKDVANLGDAGEIKTVADGYARNYLIPSKLVIPAHAGSAKALAHQTKMMQKKREKRNLAMKELASSLESVESVTIPVRIGGHNKLYGSVTAAMVSQALAEKGFSIDKRKIELVDPIRSTGNYKLKVKLADGVQVSVTVNVVPDLESQAEIEKEQEAAEIAAELDEKAEQRDEAEIDEFSEDSEGSDQDSSEES